MKSGRTGRRTSSRPPFLVGFICALLAAGTLSASPVGPATALTGPSPGTFAGRGFDACTAPPQDTMTAWLASSPYRAVGIYIGGNNRGCAQPQLTASWVSTQRTAGWHLLPIYFGPQPFCTTSAKPNRFTAANASATARTSANDAVAAARGLGLATGGTIFNDIEGYNTSDAACRAAVLTYQSVWTGRVHELGFLSGFYSSLGSGIRDQVAVYSSTSYVRPDYLWFARYDGVATTTDAAIPSTSWPHRRLKQYRSPQTPPPPIPSETYGGKTVAVDRNQVDVTPLRGTPFGDFNGNGWSDLLVRQTATGSLLLYPGNGMRFGSGVVVGTGTNWNSLNAITRFGDFDRDGHEDVIARDTAGALWLYKGAGTGFPSRLKIGASGWNALREITPVGDINGDGFPDLLAVQSSTGSMFLYPGRGTGLGTRRLVGGGWNALSEFAGVGDFNRDGRVDMVARTNATGELWLYRGTGTTLGSRVRIGSGGWNGLRDLVGVGDFDRDGFTDLSAVQSSTGRLLRYPGRGTGLGTAVVVGSGWTTGLRPAL
jgi:hypothetical protein